MATLQSQKDPAALDLDTGWSLTEQSFALIVDVLKTAGAPRSILEFGSGRSTVRFSLAFPEASILSIESDEAGFLEAQRLAGQFGREKEITLRYRPLASHSYGSGEISSYQSEPLVRDRRFDCVIIDGPPYYVLRGREICLYEAYSSLEAGGLVILDDCYRPAEQTIVSNWLSVYSGSFAPPQILDTRHGIAVLEKIKSVAPNWQSEVLNADRQKVAARRQRMREALMHLGDDEWLFFLNHVYPKDAASPDHFAGMIRGIREAHGVSPEQIREALGKDAMLADADRQALIENCFKAIQNAIGE